jgi:hypothetical protein
MKLKRDIVVVDLDGTLSNGKARNWAVPNVEHAGEAGAWDEHNMLAGEDTPISNTIELIQVLSESYRIYILTGRCLISKDITIKWLKENRVPYDRLIMRQRDDLRADTIYKEEELLNFGLDRILCCFDDLEHVATMIRGLGLTCYLVNKYSKKRVNTGDWRND